jgi:hypothetical protein
MELTGLCGQRFRLTLNLAREYSRQPDGEPIVMVLAQPNMPAEHRGHAPNRDAPINGIAEKLILNAQDLPAEVRAATGGKGADVVF